MIEFRLALYNRLSELSKGLSGKDQDKELVDFKALIEGLDAAVMLDLKRITVVTDNPLLYQHVAQDGGRAVAKRQAPKDWESMSLSEKAVGLYVGEKMAAVLAQQIRLRFHLHRDWGMDSLLVCGSCFKLVDEFVKYVDEFEKAIYLTSNNHD